MLAANTFSPLLAQLESEHLAKFNITWNGLNQHLFHKLFFTEPKIQKVLPFCISKVILICDIDYFVEVRVSNSNSISVRKNEFQNIESPERNDS